MTIFLVLIFLVALFTYQKRNLTFLRLTPSPNKVMVIKNIRYIDDGLEKHRLDLYLPKNKKDFSIVQFVHGGYWTSGDKDYYAAITGLYGSTGRALAAKGIGVVIQNYRLAPDVQIDGEIDDVVSAIKWTQNHIAEYGGDPTHHFLMGHSAGGHLITILGLDPEYFARAGIRSGTIRGYISLSGIVDLNDMAAKNDEQFKESIIYRVFGRDPETLMHYSPTSYIQKSMPPFLIMIGEHDFDYLIPETNAAIQKMKDVGASPKFKVIAGNTHMDMVLKFGSREDNMTQPVVDFIHQSQ